MTTLRLLLAALLVTSGIALVPAAPVDAQTSSSAVTKSGHGEFEDLRITVSHTKDLINQTVRLTWTGGRETGPVGRFATNYLQVMQCWGDDPAGPTREQCQFGGLEGQNGLGLGNFTKSRQIAYSDPADPDETVPVPTSGAEYAEFHASNGKRTKSFGTYFDAGTTNEVPFAKTRPDGTGELDFEVQTALEAFGLGCGEVRTSGPDAGKPRHCWLVVVPRGDTEVNGRKPGVDHTSNNLDSSPLSAGNWRAAIPFKLDFRAVGAACPIGAAERSLAGHEFVADAVGRWQPALCADGGTVFGYTRVSDRISRERLAAPTPGMVFLSEPQPSTPQRPVVYAPIAVSGLAIAFIMERQSRGPAVEPEDVWRLDGQPLTELRLTPRLVAKLLTQSYRDAVPGNQPYLATNARRLNEDPEFLALNEQFQTYGALMNTLDVLVPSVDFDLTAALWTWIDADPDARAFLDGEPDPAGMVVNQHYRGLDLPVQNFPKQDLSCKPLPFPLGPDCALTARPLAADLHEAGRAISRGDTLGRSPSGLPDQADPTKPGYTRVPRQPAGERSLLAVVDTATAARYGLPTAKLRNAAGNFVAPDDAGLRAAVGQLTPTDVQGVGRTNPTTKAADAYPLPAVTYAAAVPSEMTAAEGAEYAGFLRYATGTGQQRGEGVGRLPLGYLPLPDGMRRQAADAAGVVERDAGKPIVLPTPGGETAAAPPAANRPRATTRAVAPPAPAKPPVEAAVPSTKSTPVAQVEDTPANPVGWWLRHLLAGLLVAGGLATGAGPLVQRFGGRGGS
ncbi:hypothetical protein B0I31_11447 [Saccharothrix carnea]|uniref:Uncharacterized protein n=1 Tax=Saccharothrix carnea TaxID=1280637 RepID=A0A2P8I170_SACCR|nr:hypothetical protein [Saccharothrix carnea]PSL52220.1 hypothetical protein B0I31_11447 [Saccharothrix carnea]